MGGYSDARGTSWDLASSEVYHCKYRVGKKIWTRIWRWVRTKLFWIGMVSEILTLANTPLGACSAAPNFWFCHHPNCTCISALLSQNFPVSRSTKLAIWNPMPILREQGTVLAPLGRNMSYFPPTSPKEEFSHNMKKAEWPKIINIFVTQ